MHRRELLSLICGIGTLGEVDPRFASRVNDRIEDRARDGWVTDRIAVNRTEIDARVVDRSPESVTVRLRSSDPAREVVPVVLKRRYPRGETIAVGDGPRAGGGRIDREVTVEFGSRFTDRFVGPWQYEVRCRTPDEERTRYLCESDPLRRRPIGGFDGGPALTEAPDGPSTDGVRFERVDREGRYELQFQWLEDTGGSWTLECAIGKSAYERARRRPGGFVRTFLESRVNPYAAYLVDRLDTAATPPDGSGDANGERETDEAARLERVVGFVQSLAYGADADTKGRLEYHRTVEETLVDGTGDCNDRTYLLAGLLAQPPFGYETALVVLPDHLLLGVRREDLPRPYHDRGTIGDSPYVPVETTMNVPIGSEVTDPVVAVLGDTYASVDPRAAGSTLDAQLRAFAGHLRG